VRVGEKQRRKPFEISNDFYNLCNGQLRKCGKEDLLAAFSL